MEETLTKKDINDAVVCREEDTCTKTAKVMKSLNEKHIYVIDGKENPIGIISVTDISNRIVAEGKNPEKLKAKEIMTPSITSFKIGDNIKEIIETMVQKGFFICPVTENGKIIGECELHFLVNKLNKD